jgi:hypothetical protein
MVRFNNIFYPQLFMKKRSGLRRAVQILSEKDLHGMNTRQLLGRLKRLRFCEDSFHGSDLLEHEVQSCAGILFKDTPEWKDAYKTVRRVLAGREHIAGRAA